MGKGAALYHDSAGCGALGATARDVGRLVLGDVLSMVCAGLVAGTLMVLWSRPLAANLIQDLKPESARLQAPLDTRWTCRGTQLPLESVAHALPGPYKILEGTAVEGLGIHAIDTEQLQQAVGASQMSARNRASFMKDDEYTRTVTTLDLRASSNPDVQSNLPIVLRSLQKPDARRFAEYLASQTSEMTLLGANGAPWGEAIAIDRPRINATGARVIRGLFFIEMRRALSQSAILRVEGKAGVSPRDPAVAQFARLYNRLPNRRDGAVGKAFSYATAMRRPLAKESRSG